jgi:hypothetical protein
MKTSDKILLYSSLGVIGLFLALDLVHYASYSRGEILDFAGIEQQDFERHQEEGIRWLVLNGPMRTTFYPADRLTIDVDRSRKSQFSFERHGDTLLLSLENAWSRSAHDDFRSYGDYVPVHVFFPALKGIKLIGGFAVLDNEEGRRAPDVALELDSTQCYVGNYDMHADTVYSIEPWDTIKVQGVNCNLIVNRQAHVRALDLRMDANSEVSDRFSRIDTGYIRAESTTTLHLRGENLKKLRLDAVATSP